MLGVQWHPEMMAYKDTDQLNLFKDFVDFVDEQKEDKN
jgi:putative glutamine amidotransferase